MLMMMIISTDMGKIFDTDEIGDEGCDHLTLSSDGVVNFVATNKQS